MTQIGSEHTGGFSVPVEQVARLVHSFDRQQKVRLLQLVPELQTIRPEEIGISPEQTELMAYLNRKLDTLPERRPMQDNDPFLGGLTVAEFFALPENQQARVWDQAHDKAVRQAHDKAERELKD